MMSQKERNGGKGAMKEHGKLAFTKLIHFHCVRIIVCLLDM